MLFETDESFKSVLHKRVLMSRVSQMRCPFYAIYGRKRMYINEKNISMCYTYPYRG